MVIEAKKKKLVIVGDGACGKSCLLIVFTKGSTHIWRHQFIRGEWGDQELKKIWWRVVAQFIYSKNAKKFDKKSQILLALKDIRTYNKNVNLGEERVWRSGDVIYGCPNYPK